MRISTMFIGLAFAIAIAGIAVYSVQAKPPKQISKKTAQFAQRGGPPPWVIAKMRGGGQFQQRAARFKRIDTNNDGKISKEEVIAIHAKADANGDGLVTREELSKHIMKARGRQHLGRAPSAKTLFKNFDSNKDGKLTKDEVPFPVWNHLQSADADKNGSVTKAEYEKARSAKQEKSKNEK